METKKHFLFFLMKGWIYNRIDITFLLPLVAGHRMILSSSQLYNKISQLLTSHESLIEVQ
jgi:hypothetical protein